MGHRLNFDYVIVGAGSAGCVMAARLSEDPAVDVLLLEAGGWDWHPLINVPIGIGVLHQSGRHDWGLSAEPDPGLEGRMLRAQRGRGIGGSHAINVMGFTRGHAEDYDNWARNGAEGWSFEECLPYFRKLETWADGEADYRGKSGPLNVQFAKAEDPVFDALEEAARASGYPECPDFNMPRPEGFGAMQFTIKNGHRHSTARAYLYPARHRRNLSIVTGARATAILFDGNTTTGLRFDRGGRSEVVTARRNVIVSAGAYMTPQLLQLSGIGPADELARHGIEPRADLPVGQNLQDHLGIWYDYDRRTPSPFRELLRIDRIGPSFMAAWLLGKGPATRLPARTFGFLRLRGDSVRPDVEIMFRPTSATAHIWCRGLRAPARDQLAIRPTMLHPKSRGKVTLRSTDPLAAPVIDNNFLTASEDMDILRAASRLSLDLMRRPELEAFIDPVPAPFEGLDDDALDAWIRQNVATANHPCGTCAIGTVVDSQLGVLGLKQLSVVDASVMPTLVSGHINAAVIMMAEKAADVIRQGSP